MDVVDLSRLQFAITALYHFLFVPLTLGLAWILVIMESCYVLTNKKVYKDMTQFWGKLFGINFALGVTTGITMEFEFGTNWSQYSHYVGDIFGAPLAIEGLMAFFLEATFVGLFFLGWNRLSKRQHLLVTILTAVGTNLSALWILVDNAWMQFPTGATFNIETMRMEMYSFGEVLFSPVAQAKFVHTVSAGYVCASMFVLGISSWYLLKKRDNDFAKKSFRIAAAFGLAAVCSVIVLGDESGYTVGEEQQTKLAAIEAMWETEPAPAPFNLIAFPNEQEMKNDFAIEIPWLMGIIGTRSFDKQIPGIIPIVNNNEQAIRRGIPILAAVDRYRSNRQDKQALAIIEHYNQDVVSNPQHKYDLGLAMLLKGEMLREQGKKAGDKIDVTTATEAQIKAAARASVPSVSPLFWSFRIMVALGFLMLIIFILAFWYSVKGNFAERRWLQKLILISIPLPWIAIEFGWLVAEYGRQPWTIFGILPTNLSASSLSEGYLIGSIFGFVAFYTLLLVVEMFLMFKYARLGPSSLGTGRYDLENKDKKIGG